jgi:curved DNA-binding protein
MNYYNTLQIEKTATQEEVKRAYRKLAKEYHPDKNKGDDSLFKNIANAYETLGDVDRRREYDIKTYGGNNPFGNWTGSFQDMFDDIYGGSAKGEDVTITMLLSYEDAYYGTSKYIDLGYNALNVNIPKGVYNGMKLKISGKGRPHHLNSTSPPGDLIIIIQLNPRADLILNGSDIYIDAFIPFFDMILGTEIEVSTPFDTLKINVPPASQNNKILRISGKGFPIYRKNSNGNLMVKLHSTQSNLSDKQLDLIKKIKKLEHE